MRFLVSILCCFHFAAYAQQISKDEAEKIWANAKAASQTGPSSVSLGNQAKINLPAGRVFVPQPHASLVLNAMGNPGKDTRLQGVIFPNDNSNWFMTVRYEDAGFVKDDDAKDWNADELLKSYKEGTEASNEERVKMGVPPMEVLGWAEKPAYDKTTHRLVWAMSSRDKGAAATDPQGVNYNTYALGREGYYSMNLVTGLAELPQDKPKAQELLNALQFNDGKKYADFNSSTDKVAEYGLAALVVGVAAKKLGFFAVAAVFFAKFAKLIFLAVAAFGAGAFKWFKRKPDTIASPQSHESDFMASPIPTPVSETDMTIHPLDKQSEIARQDASAQTPTKT